MIRPISLFITVITCGLLSSTAYAAKGTGNCKHGYAAAKAACMEDLYACRERAFREGSSCAPLLHAFWHRCFILDGQLDICDSNYAACIKAAAQDCGVKNPDTTPPARP